jgi:flagellar basal body-associated protein FliL
MAILALGTTNDSTTRLILLILMIVAVILIVTGCIIALIAWRKRLKAQNAYIESTRWNNRT